MKLYGYYRSLAAFRVRIALEMKGIDWELESLDLLKGDQFSEDFKKLNPQMVVPALVDGDTVVTQSLAILAYLDEKVAEPPLLPSDIADRAYTRSLALVAIADAHPLVVPRVRKYLADELGQSQETVVKWANNWMALANDAIEARLANEGRMGKYACGDQVTVADLCIVPQVQGSLLFKVDMSRYPNMQKIFETCMTLEAFEKAHPKNQPDFVPE